MWQRVLAPNLGEIDPEHEQEVRLVAQARAGAAWALSALVARYQPPVVRYLVRLTGSAERGRALAEVVLVRMARRVRGPHGGDHLRLWLLRACTETGLEALRHPERADTRRLGAAQGPVALIAGRVGDTPVGKWMAGWGTRRQQAEDARSPVPTQQFVWQATAPAAGDAAEAEPQAPREALKYRMVRAVLAELPYGDAQCLSLHLVAGLNQAEVAQALGITPSAARRRIVQGLQLFGRRYDAALAGLGLPPDFANPGQSAQPTTSVSSLPLPAAPPAPPVYAPPRPASAVAPAAWQAATPPRTAPTAAHAAATPTPPRAAPAAQVSPVPANGPEATEAAAAAAAADATERALTSAAIMAYLRAAAANSKPREPAPATAETIVDALPVAAARPTPVAPTDAASAPGDPPSTSRAPQDAPPATAASATATELALSGPPPAVGDVTSADDTSANDTSANDTSADDTLAILNDKPLAAAPQLISPPTIHLPRDLDTAAAAPAPRIVPVFRSEPAPEADALAEPEVPPAPQDAPPDAAHLLAPTAATAVAASAQPNLATDADAEVGGAADLDDATVAVAEPPALAASEVTAPDDLAALTAEPATGDRAVASIAGDPGDADAADDYVLVVEPEPELDAPAVPAAADSVPLDATRRIRQARRTHVLSADGEAEDPTDTAIWPLP